MNQQELIKQLIFDKISDIVEKKISIQINTKDQMYRSYWDFSSERTAGLEWMFNQEKRNYPLVLKVCRPNYLALFNDEWYFKDLSFEIDKWDGTKEKVVALDTLESLKTTALGTLIIKEEDLKTAIFHFNSRDSGHIKFEHLEIV